MPIKTYTTEAEIPADAKANAIQTQAGTFIVVEEVDTSALEAKIAEAETKREAAEKLTRKTAAELQKLQVQRTAAQHGMTEDALKQLREEAAAEANAAAEVDRKELERMRAQNRVLVLDADMKARALKAGVLPTKIEDWWQLRGREFDLTDDGKPMVAGKPGVEPDKHLAALLKLNPEWVQGTKGSGGGASGGSNGSGGGSSQFDDKMRAEQRLAAAHEAGIKE